MSQTVIAAIIQAAPVYYDLPATMDKAADLIQQAAAQGAQVIVFGETWFPGYPIWLDTCRDVALWNHAPTKQVFERLYRKSLTIPGPEVDQLSRLAKQHQVVLVLSINERLALGAGAGTLYNTLITINADGNLINHHRKLVPTYTERMVWGPGDAAGLQAVDTAVGRVGGLICWEHWMPLARHAMHSSGEQIHISVFPTVHEMHQVASRQYAFEGRTFVLTAGGLATAADLPAEFERTPDLQAKPETFVQRGGSAIIAPDGRYLAGPVYEQETILVAELDLGEIIRESMTLDVTGHYARPDIFDLTIQRQRR
jgi:nitrilase